MLLAAIQENDSEWHFVQYHLSFPVCYEHTLLHGPGLFVWKLIWAMKKQTFFFFNFRIFVLNWFVSNLWEAIFQTLKFTYMSFRDALCWGKLFVMLVTEIVSLVNSFEPERLAFCLCHYWTRSNHWHYWSKQASLVLVCLTYQRRMDSQVYVHACQ